MEKSTNTKITYTIYVDMEALFNAETETPWDVDATSYCYLKNDDTYTVITNQTVFGLTTKTQHVTLQFETKPPAETPPKLKKIEYLMCAIQNNSGSTPRFFTTGRLASVSNYVLNLPAGIEVGEEESFTMNFAIKCLHEYPRIFFCKLDPQIQVQPGP